MADPFAETRPIRPPWADEPTQPIRLKSEPAPVRGWRRGCLTVLIAAVIGLLIYFLLPTRTNILILGTDSRDPDSPVGRTDTIILTTIVPLRPEVGMLSVPRDLWVEVPGVGQNRINTAYIFAEAAEEGSGPQAAFDTIAQNFGVQMDYYVLIQFEGLKAVVDTLGGVNVAIPRPMSGYEAGIQRMNGEQALAFVRDRAGSDDFFRMERGQIFLKSLLRQLLRPASWGKLPAFGVALFQIIETDVPVYLYPRLGLALLRAGPDGIDSRVITRDYVNPFTTGSGAQVLGPDWAAIDPLVEELFGVRVER